MGAASAILTRIAKLLGSEQIIDSLVGLSPRDWQSLLMSVLAARAGRRTSRELLDDFERVPLFSPSYADPRLAMPVAAALFEAARDFESIELSPVVPLAATHLLGLVHQNNVLSATRGSELVADPTTALALIAALRRRSEAQRQSPLRLCALHRCTRMQPAPKGFLPHFRLFALITAGQRSDGVDELRRHLAVYLRAFRDLYERGFELRKVRVEIADTEVVERRLELAGVDRRRVRDEVRTEIFSDPEAVLARLGLAPLRGAPEVVLEAARPLGPSLGKRIAELAAEVVAPLADEFPEANVGLDLSRLEGIGYYSGPCVRITAEDAGGMRYPLVDGGYTRWTATLLGDGRERMLSTGIGADLICARFRRPTPGAA